VAGWLDGFPVGCEVGAPLGWDLAALVERAGGAQIYQTCEEQAALRRRGRQPVPLHDITPIPYHSMRNRRVTLCDMAIHATGQPTAVPSRCGPGFRNSSPVNKINRFRCHLGTTGHIGSSHRGHSRHSGHAASNSESQVELIVPYRCGGPRNGHIPSNLRYELFAPSLGTTSPSQSIRLSPAHPASVHSISSSERKPLRACSANTAPHRPDSTFHSGMSFSAY
jgi:hypothetical protein